MQLRLPYDYTSDFVYNFIPKFIVKNINALANNEFTRMDNYIKEKLGIGGGITEIVKYALDNSYKTTNEDEIIIDLFTTKSYKGYFIISLLKLIEYGNLDVKGTYLITKLFNRVRLHLKDLYYIYLGGYW